MNNTEIVKTTERNYSEKSASYLSVFFLSLL